MNVKITHPLLRILAALLLVGTAPCVCATETMLADPTQPPVFVQPAVAAAPVRAGTAADVAPAWPRLQSVQVSADGRSSALVDGRVVRIGERLGDMNIVAIDADGILLRGKRFDQRLALLPGIAKTSSDRAPLALRPAVAVATKDKQ
jgi:MSHA biogenesis protein MshK